MRRLSATVCLVALLGPFACSAGAPGDGGTDGGSSGSSGSAGAPEAPEGCPEFQFPEFEGPFGQLYCEVYIGCFGEVGGREPGSPKATTIEACVQLTCGNGGISLEGQVDCTYDAAQGQACLDFFAMIAGDLAGKCPAEGDAWYPDACHAAIGCAIDEF